MGKKKRQHHVPEVEQDAVLRFAVEVCKALGLPTWKIALMEKPSSKDAEAEIEPVDGRHAAKLWLSRDWMTFDDDTRRQAIVHEMIHLVHPRVDSVIHDLKQLLRPHEYNPFRRAYAREMELVVDHLAMFLDETFRMREAWDDAHNPKETSS